MKIVIIIAFLSLSKIGTSQILDSINIKCVYRLTYSMDSNNVNQKSYDTKVLEIGNHSSKYYSLERYKGDSILNADIEKGVSMGEIIANKFKYQKDKSSFKIYQNFPLGMMSVTEDIGQLYQYSEDNIAQNWQIQSDTQTVFGILCQKAITGFRGRNYTAWFTNTIPVMFGPWKFNGLPGLILKISDSQNHYVFECINIQDGKLLPLRGFEKSDFIKITRKEMRKLLLQKFEDPLGSFQGNSNGVSVIFGDSNLAIPKRPYNPIEKTYD